MHPTNTDSIKNIIQLLPDNISALPDSAVLVVELSLKPYKNHPTFPSGKIAILSNEADQNKINGAYWMGRMLPSLVMISIQTNQKEFAYDKHVFSINEYKLYSGAKKYLNIVSRFYDFQKPKTVYVFAHKDIHRFSSDNYESVTAMIPCAKVPFPVPITVYYEKSTQQYFVNEELYSQVRQKYGLPYLKLRTIPTDGVSGKSFANLRIQSELGMLGYSVSSNSGLTFSDRRDLLRQIMDSGIMTKHQTMNHLEWLIHSRSKITNMDNAVEEWKTDLIFVSQYRAFEQRSIWSKNFMSRFSNQ